MSRANDFLGMVEALKNVAFPTAIVEATADEKLKICLTCPHGKNGNRCETTAKHVSKVTGQTITSTGGCGCSFTLLHRQGRKKCHLNRW